MKVRGVPPALANSRNVLTGGSGTRYIKRTMAGKPDIKFFVFDCESVADGLAVKATRYPGSDMSPSDAIARFRQELLMESGRDFIPYTYHIPLLWLWPRFVRITAWPRSYRWIIHSIARRLLHSIFWTGWEMYGKPTLVTFNGRSFDVPLMELAAFRYGIKLPSWFNMQASAYQQHRNRYNLNSHLDLHEFLTNFGSTWFRGGLNLAAHLLNKPGKMDVQGDMVQSLYAQGKVAEINEYCRCDVLDTYFVFLRSAMLLETFHSIARRISSLKPSRC